MVPAVHEVAIIIGTDGLLGLLLDLPRNRKTRAEDLSVNQTNHLPRHPRALGKRPSYSSMEGYFLPPRAFTSEEATMLLSGRGLIAMHFDAQYRQAAHSAAPSTPAKPFASSTTLATPPAEPVPTALSTPEQPGQTVHPRAIRTRHRPVGATPPPWMTPPPAVWSLSMSASNPRFYPGFRAGVARSVSSNPNRSAN